MHAVTTSYLDTHFPSGMDSKVDVECLTFFEWITKQILNRPFVCIGMEMNKFGV